jgi:hypothetical protein
MTQTDILTKWRFFVEFEDDEMVESTDACGGHLGPISHWRFPSLPGGDSY